MTETNPNGNDYDIHYGADALELWRVHEYAWKDNKLDNRKEQYRS